MRILVAVLITSMLFGCSKETGQSQPTKQDKSSSTESKDDAAQRVFGQIDGNKKIMKKQSSNN